MNEYFWSLFVPAHVNAFERFYEGTVPAFLDWEFLNSIISLNIPVIIHIWLLTCYFYTPPSLLLHLLFLGCNEKLCLLTFPEVEKSMQLWGHCGKTSEKLHCPLEKPNSDFLLSPRPFYVPGKSRSVADNNMALLFQNNSFAGTKA